MTGIRFEGVVKPARRGGWSARGVIISVAHSQLVDTRIEPRAFAGLEPATEWLREVAAKHRIEAVAIDVRQEAR